MPSSLMLSLVQTDQDQCNPGRCSDGFRHSATKPHVPPSIIQGRQAYKRGLPKCQLGQTLFGQSARRQTEVSASSEDFVTSIVDEVEIFFFEALFFSEMI